jgi:D-hexose-6-phosphate mutarotase
MRRFSSSTIPLHQGQLINQHAHECLPTSTMMTLSRSNGSSQHEHIAVKSNISSSGNTVLLKKPPGSQPKTWIDSNTSIMTKNTMRTSCLKGGRV